ncbi:MAG: hypothetical protein ACE5K0_11355 [Candidatus Methanofastidiosia archaeon]
MDLGSFAKRILNLDERRLAIYIFLTCFTARVLLGMLYIKRYGLHATPLQETYFYFGVSNKTFELLPFDPTFWILRSLGLVLPERLLYFGVVLSATILSSLAPVLVFFLVRELHEKSIALASSLIFGFMIEPLASGILIFSHDIVQVLILIFILYLTIRIKKSRTFKEKTTYTPFLLLFIFLSSQVNMVVFVIPLILFCYFIYHIFSPFAGRLGISDKRYFLYYALFLIFLFVLVRYLIFSNLMVVMDFMSSLSLRTRGIDLVNQLLAGSPDLLPADLSEFWGKYNVLLILLPFSLYGCYLKRDALSLSVFVVGLSSSLIFSRGTRVLDIGVAMLSPLAFYFLRREHLKYLVTSALAALIIVFFMVAPVLVVEKISFLYISPLLIALLFIIAFQRFNLRGALSLTLLIFILFNTLYFSLVFTEPQVSEAEFQAMSFLREQDDGKVLVNWGLGFFVEAVSGLEPTASPTNVNFDYQRILLSSEENVLQVLMEGNVRYIIVSDRRFKLFLNPITNQLDIYMDPSFSPFLRGDVTFSEIKNFLIYKMLYEERELKNFKLIFEIKDEKTGYVVRIFKVMG